MSVTLLGPSQSNLTASLRQFLIAVLPIDAENIILAQQNRVPEPSTPTFVVMTPMGFSRLSTNLDSSLDCKMIGSISGTQMTITSVTGWSPGKIVAGCAITGVDVAANTKVVSFGTGTGGVGTYTISPSQNVASRTLSAGRFSLLQSAVARVQLDFHSADGTAADLAQIVSTTLRDGYGAQLFANQSPNYGISPLHADDPKQMPFLNENQQYEWRWVLEAQLQVNQVVAVSQEFADAVNIGLIEVDSHYPP